MATDVTSVRTAATPEGRADRAPSNGAVPSRALGTHNVALDGLRGIGILVMLGFHGEMPWTKGAFLALSQFFTLSGFFITGVLLRNHLRPGGQLRPFWIRRARRLMPAAFAALAIIVVFGATVATRQQAQALPGDVLSAATWTANWHFILSGTSYINLFAAPSPVQHFWSLAVEEQFYLVFPLALLLLLRRTRSSYVLAGALGVAALLSSTWMWVLYVRGASLDRLYYGTDTRIEELLAGAVLAVVLLHTGTDFSARVRRIIAGAGVAAFAITLWCYANVPLADGPIWRGGFFAFSLVSCTLILAAVAGGRSLVMSLFSWRPLAWIGRMCYGLYLYHWPIFLWLTPERTGLSRWPLFALRMAVTFAVATLSYYYLEQPALRGASFGVRGRWRFAIAPVVAVVLVSATLLTVNRSAVNPLETLSANASVSMPRVSPDGVLDLLVIPDRADDPVIQGLQQLVHGDRAVRLTMASPFACDGGVVATAHGRTCANWAREWPALISRHNPDAVLLYADNWAGEPLGRLGGSSPAGQTDAAAALLAPAFDLLTARGAPVVWSTSGMGFAAALRLALHPFNQAMGRLKAQRSDIEEVIGGRLPDPSTVTPQQYVSVSATALLQDTSLYQRDASHSLPRVLIVGDSQALSLGYGLDRWTAQNKRALVWNHGIEGCGLAVDGEIRSFGSTGSGMDRCRAAVQAWPSQLKAFRPDVVIVLTSLTDIQDRRLPGQSGFSSVGQPNFDTFLVHEYEHDIDTLSSTGAHVVWMTPPCTGIKPVAGQPDPYDASNLAHLDTAILPAVERARPGRVAAFDLATILCPGGKPLKTVDGVGQLRPDGVHFSAAGAEWFAAKYGEKVLAMGGI